MDFSGLKKRYVGLDVFRIISVMAICSFHTTIHLGANYGVLQSMSLMGAVFMTAFFMLSGFSLFVNYAQRDLIKISNLKSFWIKRIIGIIPMYYIVAVLFILSRYAFFLRGDYSIIYELILAPIEILGIQSNFSSLFSYSHNGGTWFISCILVCYLVYPLLQEIAKQLQAKTKIIIIFLCSGILLYSPFVVHIFGTFDIYANPFFRILEFTIGVMLAALKPKMDKIQFIKKYLYKWITVLIIGIVMILGVTVAVKLNLFVGNYMLYSLICLPCFVFILIGFSGVESTYLIKSRLIGYCNEISYVFFLAQLFSNEICKCLITKLSIIDNVTIILLGWLVCIIIAIFFHEAIEKPVVNVLKRKCNV